MPLATLKGSRAQRAVVCRYLADPGPVLRRADCAGYRGPAQRCSALDLVSMGRTKIVVRQLTE